MTKLIYVRLQVRIKLTKSPFFVYILPIILSVTLGAFVMAEALNDPERELNMWQFDEISSPTQGEKGLEIILSLIHI